MSHSVCKRCGKPCHTWQEYCGAACSAQRKIPVPVQTAAASASVEPTREELMEKFGITEADVADYMKQYPRPSDARPHFKEDDGFKTPSGQALHFLEASAYSCINLGDEPFDAEYDKDKELLTRMFEEMRDAPRTNEALTIDYATDIDWEFLAVAAYEAWAESTDLSEPMNDIVQAKVKAAKARAEALPGEYPELQREERDHYRALALGGERTNEALPESVAVPPWVFVAWLCDRQAQYREGSGIVSAMGDLIGAMARAEHVYAWKHGELDDLQARAESIIKGHRTETAPAEKRGTE